MFKFSANKLLLNIDLNSLFSSKHDLNEEWDKTIFSAHRISAYLEFLSSYVAILLLFKLLGLFLEFSIWPLTLLLLVKKLIFFSFLKY